MEAAAELMLIKRITRNGNSWVINIPKGYLRPLGYKLGQYVQITILPDQTIHIRPVQEEIYEVTRVR